MTCPPGIFFLKFSLFFFIFNELLFIYITTSLAVLLNQKYFFIKIIILKKINIFIYSFTSVEMPLGEVNENLSIKIKTILTFKVYFLSLAGICFGYIS